MSKKIVFLIIFAVLVVLFVASIIFFEIDPKNTNINYSPADPQSETDKTIRFDENGKLKILHIADPHL
ncbi:MAG: hypothetical protein II356_06380, partial [Clostridia bacterium]|nr:hypothetical protein [Clostridia bacterium]